MCACPTSAFLPHPVQGELPRTRRNCSAGSPRLLTAARTRALRRRSRIFGWACRARHAKSPSCTTPRQRAALQNAFTKRTSGETRDRFGSSASPACRGGRSAVATRTVVPSAACQSVPSGPSRMNSKSRAPWGLRHSSPRFIFRPRRQVKHPGAGPKQKARRRLLSMRRARSKRKKKFV